MKLYFRKKYLALLFTGFVAATGIVISFCNLRINQYARPFIYDWTDSIPACHVGLLLGTSPKLSNGRDNLYFKYRISATDNLFRAGKINCILISGDNHRNDYNEPEEMRKALLLLGIPDSVIYMDYAGFRTLDSVVRAKEIFGQDSLTIISQRFHNERAIYLAAQYGIYANGFNAQDVNIYTGFKTQVRELLARVKVFIDLMMNKQPHYLGKKQELNTPCCYTPSDVRTSEHLIGIISLCFWQCNIKVKPTTSMWIN